MSAYLPRDLVVCKTFDGWSLHAPGSTDEDIASGAAPYIVAGPGHVTGADRETAFALWEDQQKLLALGLVQTPGTGWDNNLCMFRKVGPT